jgi:hypothetical protein
MIQIITTLRITIRPSVDVPFYQWSESFISYTEENYVKTKKLIGYKIILSDDTLTETRRAAWTSFSDFQDFISSPSGSNEWLAREEYQYKNNITSTIQTNSTIVESLEQITSNSTVNLRN